MKTHHRRFVFAACTGLSLTYAIAAGAQSTAPIEVHSTLVSATLDKNTPLSVPRSTNVDGIEISGEGTLEVTSPHEVRSLGGIRVAEVTHGHATLDECLSGSCAGTVTGLESASSIKLLGGLAFVNDSVGQIKYESLPRLAALQFEGTVMGSDGTQVGVHVHCPRLPDDTPVGTTIPVKGNVMVYDVQLPGVELGVERQFDGSIVVNDICPSHADGSTALQSSALTIIGTIYSFLGRLWTLTGTIDATELTPPVPYD